MNMLPMLQQLHWLPVEFRIDFKMLMLTYKALNNQFPDYISELLTFHKRSFALIIYLPVKCIMLYLKLKLSFMGTDRLLPAPLDFGIHYR